MRQHLFVSIFVYLFIFMLSHCKRAENKTTSSPCPPIRPIDFRGPTGVPGAPGKKKKHYLETWQRFDRPKL